MYEGAETLLHNRKPRVRGGVEVFWVLRDVLEGRIEVQTPSPLQETKTKTRKKKLVEEPESRGGGGISKEEMGKIKKIIEEVVPNGK